MCYGVGCFNNLAPLRRGAFLCLKRNLNEGRGAADMVDKNIPLTHQKILFYEYH